MLEVRAYDVTDFSQHCANQTARRVTAARAWIKDKNIMREIINENIMYIQTAVCVKQVSARRVPAARTRSYFKNILCKTISKNIARKIIKENIDCRCSNQISRRVPAARTWIID